MEAFLFERSIDIETYDRHSDRVREQTTLLKIDEHTSKLEELDVEAILAFAERVLPRAAGKRHWTNDSAYNSCLSLRDSRSTAAALLECRNCSGFQLITAGSRREMKKWRTKPRSN